jgi:hypothetical protein
MVTGVDIFKEFLALAKTITTSATVTASFIDELEKVAPMPQVVVSYPMFPRKRYTYGTTRYKRDGFIDIEVLSFSAKEMKIIVEEIQDVMFANYKTSTSVKDLEVTMSDEARLDIGGKSAHSMVLTFDFKYRD